MEQLARRVESMHEPVALENAGNSTAKSELRALSVAWKAEPVRGATLAAGLRSATATARAAHDDERVELVWTGPNSGLVPVRHTAQVLLDVIREARQRLFLVSFVAYNIEDIYRELSTASSRGVEISILLEASQSLGGKVSTDSVATMRQAVPNAKYYAWADESKRDDAEGQGSVHAKGIVADGQKCFISSANLTNAALERNMELGVLIRGGDVPRQLESLLKALVSTRKIVRV